jgi:hypothetical protein
VYGWFTEGFDTLDLKEAKALPDQLHYVHRPNSQRVSIWARAVLTATD